MNIIIAKQIIIIAKQIIIIAKQIMPVSYTHLTLPTNSRV